MADNAGVPPEPQANPLNGTEALKPDSADATTQNAHPQTEVLPGDSAVTKAEKVERHGTSDRNGDDIDDRATKRVKLEDDYPDQPGRVKGVAPIKKEFLVDITNLKGTSTEHKDDDEAEAAGKSAGKEQVSGRGGQKTKGGQNTSRQFGSSADAIQLCKSRAAVNEFAESPCPFGEKCKFEHDIRVYLKDGRRADLETFEGKCPNWEIKGTCNAGWKCRFVQSHSKEIEHEDGRKELVLVNKDGTTVDKPQPQRGDEDDNPTVKNATNMGDKILLRKKKFPTPKSNKYLDYLNSFREYDEKGGEKAQPSKQDQRATYTEPPLRASEKRRIYYGPETPVLAPLTTQGNLPYRRLCVGLGAQVTWSEMAMGLPLLQGEKAEWALIKAHESEMAPPNFAPKNIVYDYDNSKDLRFGAQIAANKPWLALKTTEVLTSLAPNLRAIDLNCGCPIELVCRQGAGSALLDTHGKLEKTLRGMGLVSGEVPITVKIRMGTKDKQPTADRLCQRLVMGGPESQDRGDGPCGVAAITLHGRSKQQRYTRSADWEYISETAALVNKLRSERHKVTDTANEPDARDLAPKSSQDGLPYFCGNGDILSHVDYNNHIEHGGVDSCMIARGALIKPWIFEEIATNQYLDKSASERLSYIEQFVRFGLEYWGSDEYGIGNTRRFLLEWLSFSCRYVPIGLLEYLPPKFGDRPPAFKGRSDLETLLSSANYKDWIKISEMFLGKAHDNFRFEPKHKSNSYEIEAEG